MDGDPVSPSPHSLGQSGSGRAAVAGRKRSGGLLRSLENIDQVVHHGFTGIIVFLFDQLRL